MPGSPQSRFRPCNASRMSSMRGARRMEVGLPPSRESHQPAATWKGAARPRTAARARLRSVIAALQQLDDLVEALLALVSADRDHQRDECANDDDYPIELVHEPSPDW